MDRKTGQKKKGARVDITRCLKCGGKTVLITDGKWKGTRHCEKCDTYQEWLKAPFSI